MTRTPLHTGSLRHRITCTLVEWLEHGPYLVREYPVARVVLLEARPTELTRKDAGRTMFVWSLLPGHPYWPDGEYASREEAVNALSDNLIVWARRQKPEATP